MIRRKGTYFTAVGLLAFVVGLVLRNWGIGSYAHFASGFLLGLSIVLLIAGRVKRSRSTTR